MTKKEKEKLLDCFGEKVKVNKIVVKKDNGLNKVIDKVTLNKPVIGRIVGGKYIKEVETDRDYDGDGYLISTINKHKKTIFVLEIKIGFLNKTIFAFPEDISFPTSLDYSLFPFYAWSMPFLSKRKE